MTAELHIVGRAALLRALDRAATQSTPLQRRLLDALPLGRVRLWGELIDDLYGADPDGGPLNPQNVIKDSVWWLRKLGYPIRNHHGFGLSIGRLG